MYDDSDEEEEEADKKDEEDEAGEDDTGKEEEQVEESGKQHNLQLSSKPKKGYTSGFGSSNALKGLIMAAQKFGSDNGCGTITQPIHHNLKGMPYALVLLKDQKRLWWMKSELLVAACSYAHEITFGLSAHIPSWIISMKQYNLRGKEHRNNSYKKRVNS